MRYSAPVFLRKSDLYSVLLGDLVTRPKNQNLGLTIAILYFLAYYASMLINFNCPSLVRKTIVSVLAASVLNFCVLS